MAWPGSSRAATRSSSSATRAPMPDYPDADYAAAGAHLADSHDGALPARGADRQGQGAAAGGIRLSRQEQDAFHLPAPRRQSRTDRRAAEIRRDGHRVRDGHGAAPPSAARTDERDRGAHVGHRRRSFPGAAAWRQRRLARRRAGRVAGPRRRARRRDLGRQCGADGHRPRRGGDDPGSRPGADALSRHHAGCDPHALLHRGAPVGDSADHRPAHRRGAGARRTRAEARLARHAALDEARQRLRRHRHRPGRLRGNVAADHARRSRLRRGGRAPLLRRRTCPAPTRARPRRR